MASNKYSVCLPSTRFVFHRPTSNMIRFLFIYQHYHYFVLYSNCFWSLFFFFFGCGASEPWERENLAHSAQKIRLISKVSIFYDFYYFAFAFFLPNDIVPFSCCSLAHICLVFLITKIKSTLFTLSYVWGFFYLKKKKETRKRTTKASEPKKCPKGQ